MTDIVKELREYNAKFGFDDRIETLFTEAADEIERLREELKHTRALADTLRKAVGVTGWTPAPRLGRKSDG